MTTSPIDINREGADRPSPVDGSIGSPDDRGMASRAYLLFESQAPRLSRRTDMTVILVIYTVMAISQLFFVVQVNSRHPGLDFLRALTVLHAAMAVLLGVRLAGDVAGDRSSGVVGLLYLTGLRSGQIVGAQWMSLLAVFGRAWCIRVPLVVLAFYLGGPTISQILATEALLLGMFLLTTSVGLLVGQYSHDRTVVRMVFSVCGILDFLLTAPMLLLNILSFRLGWTSPDWLEQATDSLLRLRVSSNLLGILMTPRPSWGSLSPLLLYGGLAGLFTWLWKRTYFTCLDGAESPPTVIPGGTTSPPPVAAVALKSKSRPSRPIWDDPLAWQAYHVHSTGQTNTLVRSLVLAITLSVAAVLMFSGDRDQQTFAVIMLIATTTIMMFIGQAKVSDCLQKEIKEQTIPALLMTPYSTQELCAGWSRGAWKLQQLDLILYAACLAACLWTSPDELSPAICIGAAMLLSCGPFFVLSPLIPFSFGGIATGVWLITLPFMILGVAAGLTVEVHRWLGFVVAIPLAFGWNRLCWWMIPRWFDKKVKDLV